MQADEERSVDESTSSTTRFLQYSNENPTEFLNFLASSWESDAANLSGNAVAVAMLKDIKVLCENGDRLPLTRTYLPVPKLVSLCEGYMLENERFPFLKLRKPPTTDEDLGSWAFLESHFGVGTRNDLGFYLDILRSIRQRNNREQVKLPRRILQLYLRIHAACEASNDALKAQQKVR